jgi:hypothetical protein
VGHVSSGLPIDYGGRKKAPTIFNVNERALADFSAGEGTVFQELEKFGFLDTEDVTCLGDRQSFTLRQCAIHEPSPLNKAAMVRDYSHNSAFS